MEMRVIFDPVRGTSYINGMMTTLLQPLMYFIQYYQATVTIEDGCLLP